MLYAYYMVLSGKVPLLRAIFDTYCIHMGQIWLPKVKLYLIVPYSMHIAFVYGICMRII